MKDLDGGSESGDSLIELDLDVPPRGARHEHAQSAPPARVSHAPSRPSAPSAAPQPPSMPRQPPPSLGVIASGPAAAGDAWEWNAPTGDIVTARIEPNGVESVYVGPRLVSRSGPQGMPNGHALPPKPVTEAYRRPEIALVVSFDPATRSFELRANGQVVPPTRVPRVAPPTPAYRPAQWSDSSPSLLTKIVVALGAFIVAGGVASVGVARYVSAARAANTPAGEKTASTKLVTLPYGAGFKLKPEVSNTELLPVKLGDDCTKKQGGGLAPMCALESSFLMTEHATRDEGLMVYSLRTNGYYIGRDPWAVSNALHEIIQKQRVIETGAFKGKTVTFQETNRQDEVCLGEPGAAVTATLHVEKETGTFWTCSFLHAGNPIMIGWYANSKHADDAIILRQSLEKITLSTN